MSSKTKIVGSVYAVGRVLIGPKKVRRGYARWRAPLAPPSDWALIRSKP